MISLKLCYIEIGEKTRLQKPWSKRGAHPKPCYDVIRLPADRAVTSAQRFVLTSCEESIMEVPTAVEISTRSSFTSDKDKQRNAMIRNLIDQTSVSDVW